MQVGLPRAAVPGVLAESLPRKGNGTERRDCDTLVGWSAAKMPSVGRAPSEKIPGNGEMVVREVVMDPVGRPVGVDKIASFVCGSSRCFHVTAFSLRRTHTYLACVHIHMHKYVWFLTFSRFLFCGGCTRRYACMHAFMCFDTAR